ncbi:hypothetical protein SCHPADRAFT_709153 [Schizopora paradoxa]|uniref:Ricin B lectin domain-containing protein n=1 Tax=Schizopora paradoxa TaxID=27342 RepID=A0A0H2R248_9AGAM|nr:hypothetical protein SCHPADRAFT_709153 [Schizopora paradoxa]
MTVQNIVQTGLYAIRNVETAGYVNLADGNTGTPLTSMADEDLQTILFNVVYLSNKNYSITSYIFPTNEAFAAAVPSNGEVVVAKSDSTQWEIKETNIKGNYLINPIQDNTLFWHLVSNLDGTKIKLSKDVSNASKWTFTIKQG